MHATERDADHANLLPQPVADVDGAVGRDPQVLGRHRSEIPTTVLGEPGDRRRSRRGRATPARSASSRRCTHRGGGRSRPRPSSDPASRAAANGSPDRPASASSARTASTRSTASTYVCDGRGRVSVSGSETGTKASNAAIASCSASKPSTTRITRRRTRPRRSSPPGSSGDGSGGISIVLTRAPRRERRLPRASTR